MRPLSRNPIDKTPTLYASRFATTAISLRFAASSFACDDEEKINNPADANPTAIVDGGADASPALALPGKGGPAGDVKRFSHPLGDATMGRTVFRFETFGNEGFWTRVLQLPQGLNEVTPRKLLELGVGIDSERIPAALPCFQSFQRS